MGSGITRKKLTVSRWAKKTTLVPLDMIFSDATGTVTRVQAKANPSDLTAIDQGEGVRDVPKGIGSLAKTLGIGPGGGLSSPRHTIGSGCLVL